MLSHEKEFSKREFAIMYNKVVKENKIDGLSAIAAKLEEIHGFQICEEILEINSGYSYYFDDEEDLPQVDEEEISKDSRYMKAE